MKSLTGRILIVDDERINLDFFDVMLSKLGFQVDKAADGEEALDKIVECNPDLVILDNIMPKLTGWDVTRKLKTEKEYRKYRTTPIIMFSAMNEVQDKIEGLELGVDDYITKPFNFSEVLARIRVVLRNRELAKQVARRERRLAVVESLNSSLVFFTRHIRGPISELVSAASEVDPQDTRTVKTFLRDARREAKEILATLEGLEEKIQELESKGARLKRGDLSVEELEAMYRKHLDVRRESVRGGGS
jgi:DNA-binding response OmpR family regulator